MKISIVKKKKQVEEDLFSYVKPNSQREKPITPKQKRELEQSDKESRKRSKEKAKREDDITLGLKSLHRSVLEDIVREELELHLEEAKKRKTRPVCSKANPWHDSLGRFSSKDKARSWSIRTDTKKDGKCSKGQNKTDGSGKRLFTRIICGRKDHRDEDSPKAKFKCKDGSKVNEVQDQYVRIKRSALDRLLLELEAEPSLLDENNELLKKANAKGLYTINQFMNHIDRLERARDGKLHEPSSKK